MQLMKPSFHKRDDQYVKVPVIYEVIGICKQVVYFTVSIVLRQVACFKVRFLITFDGNA